MAADSLFNGPCIARLVGLFDAQQGLARAQATAVDLLKVMEAHLTAGGAFFVGAHPTISDVSRYSYTAHAPDGHISLDAHPAIRAWHGCIEALPSFVPMVQTAPRFGAALQT